ncbi:hypothetical protein O181_092421 [Austropuccinia psidii MF-1]|uniref:Secreted protein n=1 Tax=Austropuccinia psidii MF-1 TaxID=1389203 RepID=A0A9Q3IZG4_9BASI|nr:hypothetical protein [Austropuccinia psidii MF-1]
MLSTFYLYLATLSLILACVCSNSGSKSVACGYQFNTIDYSSENDPNRWTNPIGSSNHYQSMYLNCADLALNEYKCLRTSCQDLLNKNHILQFKNCFDSKTNKPAEFPGVGSYRYLPKCSQIDVFKAPGQSSSTWWCPKDYAKHFNTGIMTCDECSFNRTIKRADEKCHKQTGKIGKRSF